MMHVLFALTALAAGAITPPTASAPAYDVRGVAIHQCSCRYACPCMFENPAEKCALAAIYHLDHGRVGGVDVSGLSFISVDGTPPIGHDNVQGGVVYLDDQATPLQRRALLIILRDHGEWPSDGRPVESVPILFRPTPTGYSVVIPGIFQGAVEQVNSRKGTQIVVDGVGFAEGARWIVGRSRVNDLRDAHADIRWNLPNTNGSWTLLHWTHS